MIIKLQRPLNDPSGDILAYDQTRKWQVFLSQTKELLALFGEKPKIYVEGDRRGGKIDIKGVVPDRGW